MYSTLLVLALAWSFLGPSRCLADADVNTALIDQHVQERMRDLRIPGLALAIVRGGKVVYLRGYGRAGPDGTPVTTRTPFLLGSTSKSFTALAIMQLVEARQIELDAPVQKYLPWFRVADEAASARITVRHLLNQTSGLPTRAGRDHLAESDPDPAALERVARRLASAPLTCAPGERFQYSEGNYVTLGALAQTVAHKPFGEVLRERVFAPLHMTSSFASPADAHGLATGHRYWFGALVPAPDLPWSAATAPDGALISSAEDLGQYLLAHLGARPALLSAAGLRELHRPAAPVNAVASYAMGWFTWKKDTTALFHGGALAHFSSGLLLYPELDLGVAVLANATSLVFGERFIRLVFPIADIARGRPPTKLPEPLGPWLCYAAFFALLTVTLYSMVVATRQLRAPAPLRRMLVWTAVDLVLVALVLVGGPWFFEATLPLFIHFQPDLGYGLVCWALITTGWALVRSILAWRLGGPRRT